jgi:hypothetical protein
MATKGIVLASNASGAAATTGVVWSGGRAALVIVATAYPSTCKLQCLGPDNTTYIDVNAAAYTANQVTAYDLPAGTYRMNLSGGTVAALYANLVSIPYV